MTLNGVLKLMACQVDIPPMTTAEERNKHLESLSFRVCEKLSKEKVDVVVLPELSSIEYSREAFASLAELAEPTEGSSFHTWRAVAMEYKTHVVYGFARRDDSGNCYISIGVVNPQGELVGYYDKLHLAQYGASMEKEYFSRGNHLSVFEVNGFRLAPIICYDIRIPELSRTLAVAYQVDVILHCGAYYRDRSFHTWHDFALTRAIENQCYLLSLNRAGKSYGNSLFCRPWHDETMEPETFCEHGEDIRVVELSKAELDDVRTTYSFLADRLGAYELLRVND